MDSKFSSVNILGVRVDNVTENQAVGQVEQWLRGRGHHYIVTPNLEFILAAQKDGEFKKILNRADLAIPDSSRLGFAYWLENQNIIFRALLWPLFFLPPKVVIQFNIVSGVDLLDRLCEVASKKGFTVGFLGGRDGVAKRAAECLQKKYPGLKVSFAEDGGVVDNMGNVVSIKYYGKKTEKTPLIHNTYPLPQCDILFVAFGQVKQEKWISNNLEKLPVKVMMGVGGSLDEISGQVPRVPSWIHKLGFKWLLRLIFQPWRWRRQVKLVRFVWKLLIN